MTNVQGKFIMTIVALLVALTDLFLLPLWPGMPVVSMLAAALFQYFGYDWRTTYTEIRSWMESKTIWGALAMTIPMIVLSVAVITGWQIETVVLFGFNLRDVLLWILGLGGITFFSGIAHAKVKKSK